MFLALGSHGAAGLVSISAACHFSARRVVGMDLDSGLIEAAKEHRQSLGGAGAAPRGGDDELHRGLFIVIGMGVPG